jgi:hypothetical protein
MISSSWSWTAPDGIKPRRYAPESMALIFLPPYSPQLNPVEHIGGVSEIRVVPAKNI